ncbi:MAG: hypothetical protein WCA10_10645 [Terracidiphilus sp.]
MEDCPKVPLTGGVHEDYEWLVTEQYLDDLLHLCPQIVVGKFVAITSIDSGIYHPTDSEIVAGWENRNGIAYSPRVEDAKALPRQGWDEWYVFNERVDLGGMLARDSNPFIASLGPGRIYAFVNSNFSVAGTQGMQDFFWNQFDRIRPQTYIAESDYFLQVITREKELFGRLFEALTELESETG